MPPIVAVHQVPSLTRERYEAVVRRLTNGKSRIESPSDLARSARAPADADQAPDSSQSPRLVKPTITTSM